MATGWLSVRVEGKESTRAWRGGDVRKEGSGPVRSDFQSWCMSQRQRRLLGTQKRSHWERGGSLWPGESQSVRTWGDQDTQKRVSDWGIPPRGGHSHEMVSVGKQLKVGSWLRERASDCRWGGLWFRFLCPVSLCHVVADVGWKPFGAFPGRAYLILPSEGAAVGVRQLKSVGQVLPAPGWASGKSPTAAPTLLLSRCVCMDTFLNYGFFSSL